MKGDVSHLCCDCAKVDIAPIVPQKSIKEIFVCGWLLSHNDEL
jgi:hypothetical protein